MGGVRTAAAVVVVGFSDGLEDGGEARVAVAFPFAVIVEAAFEPLFNGRAGCAWSVEHGALGSGGVVNLGDCGGRRARGGVSRMLARSLGSELRRRVGVWLAA